MIEQPTNGHVYTATEVQARLEAAKRDGELMKDARGVYRAVYHTPGFSGTTRPSGVKSYLGPTSIGSMDSYENRIEKFETSRSSTIKARSFSLKGFVREGINNLKAYFKKKEIKHV